MPATQFTLDELTEAYNQTRMDYIVPMPMTAARLQEYIIAYDIDLSCSCAAVDDEEPGLIFGLGMLGVRENRAWITRLGVLPYARRLGTGGAIMAYLLEQAGRLSVSRLWLEVIKGNQPAHRLFTRFGFVETRELIVSRRPPGPVPGDGIAPVEKIIPLRPAQMYELLDSRRERPNWLNETETFYNIPRLNGFIMHLAGGEAGWVIYESAALQLKRVIIGVLQGDEVCIARSMLCWLHTRLPLLDAVSENIPLADPCWAGYEAAGYFDSFHRIEMVKEFG